MKIKKAIVVPDTHAPLHDKKAVNCVLKAIDMIKPDTFIHLGDVGEWDSVSHWKYTKRKRPPVEYIIPEIDKDINSANDLLNLFDHSLYKNGCKEKYLLLGNHEVRLENFVLEHPYLKQYLPQNAMNLKERKYKWLKYGDFLQIGELFFHHGGQYKGINHARNTLLKLGANIMYAHFHDVCRASEGSIRGVHAAFCIGCLKKCDDNNNGWLKGKRTNWSQAFAIVNWDTDGIFGAQVIDITSGVCWINDKKIKG